MFAVFVSVSWACAAPARAGLAQRVHERSHPCLFANICAPARCAQGERAHVHLRPFPARAKWRTVCVRSFNEGSERDVMNERSRRQCL
eukprot:11185576-Lingulodinium_polyedra.AAC.2